MICDGVCMRIMHRLLEGVVLFVVGIQYVLRSDRLIAVIGY
jgi:hypothetical protein